ncbi:MAG: adenine nucleotide alpha hydrolase [Gammaproteobacteria bacterium SG8_11]|nr:MAG: adenine nucleotide alpha hydrolase [Gammaproteobacteria bacterium SG8_11]
MSVTTITIKPPKTLVRPIGRAISDFSLIRPDDRVLVAISGGKDSLTLLHVLLHLKRHAPVHFDVAAITVNPEKPGYDPSPLKDYMQQLGVTYFYQSQPIVQRSISHMQKLSHCTYCARIKRNIMYATARREGYNVLALAQHLDDLAESFLMSSFYSGQLRTMKAMYYNEHRDVRIVRPMIYVRERQTIAYAKEAGLPLIAESCPACVIKPQQRQHMKALLAEEEKHNKNLFKNLLTTIKPLMLQEYNIRNSDVVKK